MTGIPKAMAKPVTPYSWQRGGPIPLVSDSDIIGSQSELTY